MMSKVIFSLFLFTICLYPQSLSDYFDGAMDAYNASLYTEAARMFSEFLNKYEVEDEMNVSANFYAAESYFNLQQNNAAVQYYEFIVNNNRWTSYRELSLFRLGIIYFEEGEYDLSRERFKSLLSLYPGSEFTGTSLYWIGESFMREEKTSEAIKFLEEAVENKSKNASIDKTIFSLAYAYEKSGDYENAVKYYDRLLSFHRDSPLAPQAQIRIGVCYFRLKDYESSILELNNPMLSGLSGDLYSESLFLLANSYFKTGSYSKAEAVYREIIEKFPSSGLIREVNYSLAWCLFQQKEYDFAYDIFNTLGEGEDSIAEKSFFWKGESRRYGGNGLAASEIYKEFLEKYPESSYRGHIFYQMGVVSYDDKKSGLSEKYLTDALTSEDLTVQAKANILLGEIELSKKNYKSAAKNFELAADLVPENKELSARAHLGSGTAFYYLKNYPEAIAYLKRVSSESPDFESDKVNFYLAENLYAAGKYQDAVSKYNSVSMEDQELYGRAVFGKAYSNFNLGRYDQAAGLFADYLKKYPKGKDADDAKMRLADSYYGSKNYAAASNIYRDIFSEGKAYTNNPHLYFQYAQSLYRGGRIDEAVTKFSEIREKFPQSDYAPRAHYLIGWIYFQRNDYVRAIDQYRSTIEIYPGSAIAPVAYYSIGDAYYNLEKYDSAVVNYERIITLFPGSPNVYDALNGIQYSYIAMNKPERAIQKIEQFISDNPDAEFSDQLSFKRGEIYYSNKSYESAKNGFKSFINNYRNSKLVPDAYFWIGKSAQNLGQNEEAVYNYNMVIDNYPKSEMASSAAVEVTSIYNQMKRYDQSVRLLDKIIAVTENESPRKSEFLFLKGNSLLQKGDKTGAADVFSEISMYYKNTIFGDKAKFELGMLDLGSKNYASAENNFRELSETRTDDLGAKAQFFYGETLFRQKKYNEAITSFVRIRSIFSSYGEWLTRSFLRLGDCYSELGDKNKAADMYRTVLSRNRGDKYGEEALSKLRSVQ